MTHLSDLCIDDMYLHNHSLYFLSFGSVYVMYIIMLALLFS